MRTPEQIAALEKAYDLLSPVLAETVGRDKQYWVARLMAISSQAGDELFPKPSPLAPPTPAFDLKGLLSVVLSALLSRQVLVMQGHVRVDVIVKH